SSSSGHTFSAATVWQPCGGTLARSVAWSGAVGLQQKASVADGIGFGLAFVVTGSYVILASLGFVPAPGGEDTRSPTAIVVCAGAAFVLVGILMAIRSYTGTKDADGDLPADAPLWTHMMYRVAGIAIAGSLAAIGTWIAIGSGPRSFTVGGPMLEMRTTGET